MSHVSCRLAVSDSEGHATTSLLVFARLSSQDTKGRPRTSTSTSDLGIRGEVLRFLAAPAISVAGFPYLPVVSRNLCSAQSL